MNKLGDKWFRITDEQGSGLVLTLMVLMVLAVLGAAIATMTLGSYQMTSKNRDTVSAYYVAEAALNEEYNYIKKTTDQLYNSKMNQNDFFSNLTLEFNKIDGKKIDSFSKQFGEQPSASLSLTSDLSGNPRTYTLTSEGTLNGTKRIITKEFEIEYQEKNGDHTKLPSLRTNTAAIVKNKIVMSGSGKINGDVYLDSMEPKSIFMNGNSSINKGKTYIETLKGANRILDIPRAYSFQEMNGPYLSETDYNIPWDDFNRLVDQFPEIPQYDTLPDETIYTKDRYNSAKIIDNGSFYYNSWILSNLDYVLNIEKDVSFNYFLLDNSVPLNINTSGKDVTIVVNDLKLNRGDLNIIGSGSITFIVKNSAMINLGKINLTGKAEQLGILYAGSDPFVINGGQMNGIVFVKKADVNVNAMNGLNGALISGGKLVTHNGATASNAAIIAPRAYFDFTGSGKINGSVVGESLSISGAGEINHNQLNFNLKFLNNNEFNATPANALQLIKSSPTVEK